MSNESVQNVLLMIADIGGYTEFMVSTNVEIEHSQQIITQLIQSIISQIESPLKISKLEGDALFVYAVRHDEEYPSEHLAKTMGVKLFKFFEVFHRKQAELEQDLTHSCGACANVNILKLKIIVHSGEALFYRIEQFDELSGGDVILIHRLLKNSVAHDEYILMTGPAYSYIDFPSQIEVEEGTESYEHLGEIKTLVYHPQ